MLENLITLEGGTDLNLQTQLRQQIVALVTEGLIPAGQRLPSSRRLADHLAIARNTVVLAYQQLIDEGYLVSRERSGIYVNEAMLSRPAALAGVARSTPGSDLWRSRLPDTTGREPGFGVPPNWQDYPYPFLEGEFDQSLFPVAEWRESSRLALGVREINDWSRARGDADDPQLIEQIRTKILPRRGISARADEILITSGAQEALALLAHLLFRPGVRVAMEEPGYPDFRALVHERGAELTFVPVDAEGLCTQHNTGDARYVYVTPSHQVPTTVTMSSTRRAELLDQAGRFDQVIIEDDFDSETNFLGNPHPAIKSADTTGRVLYLGSLSKIISPGLRLGYLVADPGLIQAARDMRRLFSRFPAANNQRTAAFFLSLGHYDATMRRLHETFKSRWTVLRDALNYYLTQSVHTMQSEGGTCCWVEGPAGLAIDRLCAEAEKQGILIEPVDHYFGGSGDVPPCFRVGVSSLPLEQIRPGIARLADLIKTLSSETPEALDDANPCWLTRAQLSRAFANARILSKTVYGQPLTIDLFDDGTMVGYAGFANEERDEGRWWVEGDQFCRQWQQWSFSEPRKFFTVIEGDQVRWFDDQRVYIDSGVLRKRAD